MHDRLPADRAGVPGQAGQLLGADTRQVELVAINSNPRLPPRSATSRRSTARRAWPGAELAVPDRHPCPAPAGLAALRRSPPRRSCPAGSMIGHGDYAFVIDQAGHLRQELGFDTGPGHHGHQVVVRRRAGRRRPATAGALMSRPARPAAAALALAAAVLAAGCGSPAARAGRPRGRGRRRRAAVPGHLPGHRRGHLGGRGDGRLGRRAQQLLAAVRPPGRHRQVAAGHPARGGRQRRPGGGRAPARVADRRVPAQPVPDLHAAGHHPRRRQRLGTPARSTPPWPTSPTPWPPPRTAAPARPAHQRRRRAGRPRLHQLDDPGHPAGPRRHRRRPAAAGCGSLTAAAFTPVRGAAAGRQLQPPGNRRHLRRHRAGPGTQPGPRLPAALARQRRHRAPADHAPPARTVALLAAGTGPAAQPARRLVHRQRQPLGPVAAAAAAAARR